MIIASVSCLSCNDEVAIKVRREDLNAYSQGALVQDAFPYFTREEREILTTRTCGKCIWRRRATRVWGE